METPLVDLKILTDFLAHEIDANQAFFNSLLKEFKATLNVLAGDEFSVETPNMEKLAAHAHKFKVSCKSFGAQCLGMLFEDLEKVAKAKQKVAVQQILVQIMGVREKTFETLERHAKEFFGTRSKSA